MTSVAWCNQACPVGKMAYQQELLLLQGSIHECTVMRIFLAGILSLGQRFCFALHHLQEDPACVKSKCHQPYFSSGACVCATTDTVPGAHSLMLTKKMLLGDCSMPHLL